MYPICLTAEDCTVILNNFEEDDFTLSNFSLKPFSTQIRGFLGNHLLLTLEVENKKVKRNLSFFVKSLQLAVGLSGCFEDQQFFKKEVFIYKFVDIVRAVVPDIKTDVIPRLYYYTSDETIVLENLAESGYKGIDSLKFNKDHMFLLLDALAKFHAISIAFEEYKTNEIGRKYEISEDYSELFSTVFTDNIDNNGYKYTKSCEIGAKQLIDLIYGDEGIEFKQKLEEFVPKFLSILNAKNNFRKVISHGDIWSFNCLFKYDNKTPIDCKLIDFQIFRYAPPAHDVTMAIYFASNRKDFQNNVHDYYKHYYKSLNFELSLLNLNIDNILPFEEFEETCKIYMPCAKFIWWCYRQTSSADEEYMKKNGENPEKLKSVVIGEGRAECVKYNYENFEHYKTFMDEVVEDNYITHMHNYISIEECYKIIEERIGSKDYTLNDYSTTLMEEKYGFLGDHYLLKITITHNQKEMELNYFAKLMPIVESQKQFLIDTGANYKEIQFFNNIQSDFLKHQIKIFSDVIPKCYIANSEMILLDNLVAAGYAMPTSRESLQIDDFKLCLRSLAKLHASGIIYEEKTNTRLIDLFPNELKETFYTLTDISVGLLEAGKRGIEEQIKMFSNYTSNITPDEFCKEALKYVDSLRELNKPSTKYRNAISHGDLWGNNIMLSKNNAIFVDFQSYRYCPPSHDLMQMIYLILDREIRSNCMQEVLDYYYSEFKSIIEQYGYDVNDILCYQDFLESCESDEQFAIIQHVTHFQIVMLGKERTEVFYADKEYCRKSMFVDRADHVKTSCALDPIYRQKNMESIMDLRKFCEKKAAMNK